jgi:hypothetical protein
MFSSDCRGKKASSSLIFHDSPCGLRAAYQHIVMHFGRSGRTVTRFPQTHNGMPDPHFTLVGGIALSAPRSNVPVGREPNVTLIVDIQGSGRVAPGSCWTAWKTTGNLQLFGKSTTPQHTGRKAIALRHFVTTTSRSQTRDGNGKYFAAAYTSRRHDVFCALIPTHRSILRLMRRKRNQ